MDLKNQSGAFTSGKLGAAVGVSADTIRHYEKLGLLSKPVRTDGGYRLYPPETLRRVQTIRSALRAGFSLAELAGIFKERAAGKIPCHRVAEMASDKVAALDEQIAELIELRQWLAKTLDTWKKRLKKTPSGSLAGLLELLAEQERAGQRTQLKGRTHEGNNSGSGSINHDAFLRAKRYRSSGRQVSK